MWKVQKFGNPKLLKFRSKNLHYAYKISTIFSLKGWLSKKKANEN